MCAECNKDDGGKCGYIPEQCNSYWLSARSKRCPSSGQAPMNVGNLRCISDDVQGEQGWCPCVLDPAITFACASIAFKRLQTTKKNLNTNGKCTPNTICLTYRTLSLVLLFWLLILVSSLVGD